MKKVEPWSGDGIEPDIRDAAREAAQRQGMTLNEWLNDVIASQAAEHHRRLRDMTPHERIEAVAARLHQLGGREDRPFSERENPRGFRHDQASDRQNEAASRMRPEDEERFNDDTEQRLRRAAQDRATAPQNAEIPASASEPLFNRRRSDRDRSEPATPQLSRSQDYQMPRDAARAAERTADFSDVVTRMSEIEREIKRRAAEIAPAPLTEERAGDQLSLLERRLAEIERQFTRKPQASVPSEPRNDDALHRLEAKLDALLSSSSLSPSRETQTFSARPAWQDSVESAVAEIGHKQRMLDHEPMAHRASFRRSEVARPVFARERSGLREPEGDLPQLQHEIAALSQKLEELRLQDLSTDLNRVQADIGVMSAGLAELAPRESVNAIETAIRNLTARLETSREEGLRETLLQPLTEFADDIRHSVKAIDPKASLDGLAQEIRAIGDKLGTLGGAAYDAEALAQIQQQTQEIHALLKTASAHPLPLDQIEAKISTLSHQIERQRSGSGETAHSLKLAETQAEGMSKIEERLERLSRKLDKTLVEAPAATAPVDRDALEMLVQSLAEKFSAAQQPQADQKTLEALQAQIGEMARRLEHSDAGFSALTSLQRSVEQLFTHLDETRYSAQQVAQHSAETAAREAVRELMRQPGIATSTQEPALTREIADLRFVQDEADRRTHSTLNAVHETLEKIVDRLAMLEEDIAEAGKTDHRPAAQPSSYDRESEMMFALAEPRRRSTDKDPKPQPNQNLGPDFLIEPSTSSSVKGTAGALPGDKRKSAVQKDAINTQEPERSRSDFIAAARRAAQAAQADIQLSQEAVRPKLSAEDLKSRTSSDGLLSQAQQFLIDRKRQLTLSIAALFLAVGAYAVVKTMERAPHPVALPAAPHVSTALPQDGNASSHPRVTVTNDAAAAPQAAPRQDASTPASDGNSANVLAPGAKSELPPPATLSAAGLAVQAPQKTWSGSDPIVTSSITPAKPVAPPSAETPAAAAALRDQAESGNATAQYELASRYAEGRLVTRDFKAAATWYEKAATQGLAPAQYRLGSLYEKGVGVTRDLVRAKELYEKAAAQGHARAMHNLAVLTAEGAEGKPDYAAASTWFRKAADYGIRDSQYNLGILFARGLGVSQDLVQSYTWFAIAAAQGDEDAAKKRDDVAARLDAASLIRAKAGAETFRPRVADRAVNEVQLPPNGWEPMPAQAAPKKAKISRL